MTVGIALQHELHMLLLNIRNELRELMGGHLQIEIELARGTCVTL